MLRFFNDTHKQKQIVKGVVDAVTIIMAVLPIEMIYYGYFKDETTLDSIEQRKFQESFCHGSIDDLLYVSLYGPLLEEITCRGFALYALNYLLSKVTQTLKIDQYYAEIAAIIGQSLLFAIPHHPDSQTPSFFKGLVYGYLGLYNPSHLLGSFAAHATHNTLALAETCLLPEGDLLKTLGLR